jgi:hypothetical protein
VADNPAVVAAWLRDDLTARIPGGADTFVMSSGSPTFVADQLRLTSAATADLPIPAGVGIDQGSLWLRVTRVSADSCAFLRMGEEVPGDPPSVADWLQVRFDNSGYIVVDYVGDTIVWPGDPEAPPTSAEPVAVGDTVDVYVEWLGNRYGLRVNNGPLVTSYRAPLLEWTGAPLSLRATNTGGDPPVVGVGPLYLADRPLDQVEIGMIASTVGTGHDLWLALVAVTVERGGAARLFDWDVRCYVCDIDGNVRRDITAWVENLTVDMNLDRAVRLVGKFDVTDASVIERYTDYVQAIMHRVFPDGTQDDIPLGFFCFTQPKRYIGWTYTAGSWEGYDLTALLINRVAQGPYNLASGVNVGTAIADLIQACGINRYRLPSTSVTLDGPRTWPPGTTYAEIAGDLCDLLGWYALYSDPTGWLTTAPIVDKQYVAPWATVYPDDQFAELVEVPTDTQVRNVVIVRRLQPDQDPIYAVATNDRPDSPTSTVNIGTRAQVVDVNELADETAAQQQADYLLSISGSYYVTLDMYLLPDPTIDLHQTIDVHFINERGTDLSGRYWIRTWRMNLGGTRDASPYLTLQAHRMVPFQPEGTA